MQYTNVHIMLHKLKQAAHALLAIPKEIHAIRYLRRTKDLRIKNSAVPYVSQFATPELIDDILNGKIPADQDPNWEVFGYETKSESGFWATRQCGVACAKMLIDTRAKTDVSMAQLCKECEMIGGYNTAMDTGWYYKPLAQLLRSYGLRTSIASHLSINRLVMSIANGANVIASVNPQIIRDDENITNTERSGHLVLVVGFEIKNHQIQNLIIHNPSGRTKQSRVFATVPASRFISSYGKLGIIVY